MTSTYDSVILSGGGMESLVLLAQAAQTKRTPLVVYVQMNRMTDWATRAMAERQCEAYGFHLHYVPAPFLFGELRDLLPSAKDRGGYIPGYRHLLLSIAFQIADQIGVQDVVHGEHAEWSAGHPVNDLFNRMVGGHHADRELSQDFWSELASLYNRTYATNLRVLSPLITRTKGGVVTLGQQLGVDWTLSLTCRTGDIHCGMPICFFCASRRAAFVEAGVVDATFYRNP